MIKANARKYSVSAMCRVLQVNRSAYYYEAKHKWNESKVKSILNRPFTGQAYRNVAVSDLTYVRAGNHWD